MPQETANTLRELIRSRLRGHKFISVSNREPYLHIWRDDHLEWMWPASGLVVALDPVMRASHGLWVAHGSGSGDRDRAASDAQGFVDVPPDDPSYRLKRVWLSKAQEENYYYGFSNSALWPLCHLSYRPPVFRQEHWEAYQEVNQLFADSVAEEVGDDRAFVFIQDYHFALLPRMLRRKCPQAVIAHFWHIPWPNPEVFRICPWKQDILRGMLGNDLLGFHIHYHGNNFMDTVDRELEARIDRERAAIIYRRHMTKIRAFPISIDFDSITRQSEDRATEERMECIRRRFHIGEDMIVGVGADRIDYTKGLLERVDAVDCFLERFPEYRGRFVFFQAGVPSRTHVKEYRRLNEDLDACVRRVNQKYGTADWCPIIFLRQRLPLSELLAWFRMARFAMVSSLHDGMNLVAKEFVASRVDGQGVLLLSRFTGAARQFHSDAVLINPYAADEVAGAIHRAIEMEPEEARRRMKKMREQVRENNVYKWAADIIRKLSKLA
ncbi:MAG TPA: trehalose-6-phosphate synthase [Candidatus Dormibacteraeota bacterium]|nr:trehalose-6-phosphate synthase [Candidatus Dormibacteraeota bacterium]